VRDYPDLVLGVQVVNSTAYVSDYGSGLQILRVSGAATPTPTVTNTPTDTPTVTNTPTDTPGTDTPGTDTPTVTPPIPTVTDTPTDTPTGGETNTPTPTNTPTSPTRSTIQFSSAIYITSETSGTVTIQVLRTGSSSGAITVRYQVLDDTAHAGSDYVRQDGTLSFADGVTVQTFTIALLDDMLVEGNETITLLLSHPTGNSVIGSQAIAQLTITDDDTTQTGAGVLQFAHTVVQVKEDATFGTVEVLRTGGLSGTVSVQYETFDSTANAGSDYTSQAGTLIFADGQQKQNISIPITNDMLVEGDEYIVLMLHTPTGGAFLVTQQSMLLTILDDDAKTSTGGIIQFASPSFTVHEDGSNAIITVERTGDTSVAVMVRYDTMPGTAKDGIDYTPTSGMLQFDVGETIQRFAVPIINDSDPEGDEQLTLKLSKPSGGAQLGTLPQANLTINDDDTNTPSGSGMLQFSADTYTAHEHQREATLAVERIGGSNGDVAVSYVVIGGSAQLGSDYALISGKLDFANGETRKTFGVPLRDDNEIEGDENIIMLLHAVTGGATLGTRQTTIVTIVDDEASNAGILQFRELTSSVSEDNGPARVVVERIGGRHHRRECARRQRLPHNQRNPDICRRGNNPDLHHPDYRRH